MLPDDLVARGQHMLTVCNACRYCEQYCPVFPALEQRRTFQPADLDYLASLCHNCGECLYACQFAPPHEFGINLPMMLAEVRSQSYEQHTWPSAFGQVFRRHAFRTGLTGVTLLSSVLVMTSFVNPESVWPSDGSANFYGVISHGAMVAIFGAVSLFVLISLGVSAARFWRGSGAGSLTFRMGALRDALTLRHLHASGRDCVSNLEVRLPWRRWCHHCTFYGFLLCFASTSVAATYHAVFGWEAPYSYSSLPVLLGTAGGFGLLIGPLGLAALRQARDPELGHDGSRGLDTLFLLLLFLTSLTGLALLILRHSALMGILLVVHLAVVMVLMLTLPYGKFVHALYRVLALVRYHNEGGPRRVA
jgi:citrate/tricarballylate utilization protein